MESDQKKTELAKPEKTFNGGHKAVADVEHIAPAHRTPEIFLRMCTPLCDTDALSTSLRARRMVMEDCHITRQLRFDPVGAFECSRPLF
jgi:hypothetical protein